VGPGLQQRQIRARQRVAFLQAISQRVELVFGHVPAPPGAENHLRFGRVDLSVGPRDLQEQLDHFDVELVFFELRHGGAHRQPPSGESSTLLRASASTTSQRIAGLTNKVPASVNRGPPVRNVNVSGPSGGSPVHSPPTSSPAASSASVAFHEN